MPDNHTYYIEAQPGMLITAADWNGLQTKIQDDMRSRIDQAKKDVTEAGVKRADNADKFDNKSPLDWTKELDGRYAPKVHDHEGLANYRRYYRVMDTEAEPFVLLEHGLGRYPLVELYQLLRLNITPPGAGATPIDTTFLLYYGHEELDILQQLLNVRRVPRRALGTPWEKVLQEYNVNYTDDDGLDDVYNDFLDAFFKLPAADEMEHQMSDRIKEFSDRRDRTIQELKRRGEWDDIRWLSLPQTPVPAATPPNNGNAIPLALDVTHLSYDTTMVRLTNANQFPNMRFNLMILMRS